MMHGPLARLLAGLVLLLGFPARSEPVADTQAALARYPGETALHVPISISVRVDEGSSAEPRGGEATIWAEHSKRGLRVLYSPELLGRLQAEAAEPAGENAKVLASDVLSELGARTLDEALDFAGPLHHLIDGASVLEVQPATDGGLTRLEVRADPSRVDAPPYVKESELLVTLWLAEDGVPTTVDTDSRVKVGRFFITVTNHHRVHRELARVGDRLVVLKSQGQLSVSGFGQSFTKTVTMRIRVPHRAE